MAIGRKKTLVALGILSLLLTTGGAIALRYEAAPYLGGGGTAVARLMAASDRQALGISYDAIRKAVLDCAQTLRRLTSLEMRYQGDAGRQHIVNICRHQTAAAAVAKPASSYVWYAKALADISAGDAAGFNEALQRSRAFGASEQSIAELRVALAEDHLKALTPASLASHEEDLRLMVTSAVGLRSLVRRYLLDPGFRDRMAAIVEEMPEDLQRQFVVNLQRAMPQ